MSQDVPSLDPSAPAGTPQKAKKSTGTKVLIGCALMVPILVCCIGMGSAVAIPGFIRYVKQSKAAEASIVMSVLSENVRARCSEGLPTVSAGPVPLTPGSEKQIGDFASDPGFAQLRFAPPDPMYFSYSVISVGDGSSVVVAEGDLDNDGERSRYTMQCSAACDCADIVTERELE